MGLKQAEWKGARDSKVAIPYPAITDAGYFFHYSPVTIAFRALEDRIHRPRGQRPSGQCLWPTLGSEILTHQK
jgi:hypothetical protein